MSFSVTEDYFPQVQKAIPWTPGMILPPGIDILTKFRMRDRNQVKPEKFWGTVHWAQLFPFLHKLQNEIPGFLVVIWDLRAQDTLRKFSAFHDSSKWHLGLPRKKYKEKINMFSSLARWFWVTETASFMNHSWNWFKSYRQCSLSLKTNFTICRWTSYGFQNVLSLSMSMSLEVWVILDRFQQQHYDWLWKSRSKNFRQQISIYTL